MTATIPPGRRPRTARDERRSGTWSRREVRHELVQLGARPRSPEHLGPLVVLSQRQHAVPHGGHELVVDVAALAITHAHSGVNSLMPPSSPTDRAGWQA
jgi:hypothetical protein